MSSDHEALMRLDEPSALFEQLTNLDATKALFFAACKSHWRETDPDALGIAANDFTDAYQRTIEIIYDENAPNVVSVLSGLTTSYERRCYKWLAKFQRGKMRETYDDGDVHGAIVHAFYPYGP